MSEKTEVSQYEYSNKESEKRQAERDRDRYKSKRAALKNQRDRLDAAIRLLEAENDAYKQLKKDTENLVDEKRDWKGSQQSAIMSRQGADAVDFTEFTYKYRINKALDDLVMARADVNEDYASYGTLLDRALAKISSIGAWLETHFFNN